MVRGLLGFLMKPNSYTTTASLVGLFYFLEVAGNLGADVCSLSKLSLYVGLPGGKGEARHSAACSLIIMAILETI